MGIDRTKPYPVINALECKSCGRCVISCPTKVLQIGNKLNERGYHYVVYSGVGCIGCNNCFYNCPEPNAIEVHSPVKN